MLPRSRAALVFALLVGYGSFYLCRANVDAALPFLLREGYGKTRLGDLASTATLVYAVGKVVLGASGDRLGGRRLMLLAVAGSVVCSLAFGRAHAFGLLVVLAAANRFFQAGGWPGLVHIVSRRFEPARHGAVMGLLSTSYELGNVCALALSGAVARLGWRALFVVNPILFALVGGAAVGSLPKPPAQAGAPADAAPERASPAPEPGSVLGSLLRRGAFWTAVALSALLTFIRVGFLTWTPTYLAELSHATGDAAISTSVVESAAFPLAGVAAVLCVGPLSDRLGPGRRAPVMAASLAVVVALVRALGHGGGHAPVLLIAGIGFFLLGPYSLLAGAVALDLGGRRGSATASGIIDGAGYAGAVASGALLGRVADRGGWPAAFDVVAGAALVAACVATAWALASRRPDPRATRA